VVVGLGAGGLAACGDDGRSLREPSALQTTTTRPPATASTTVAGGTTAAVLTLSSDTFAEGGGIPDVHTCFGDGQSPALLWAGTPQGTAEVAVVVRDLDAGGLVHWVVAGMPAELGGFAQDTVPQGAVQATNAFGEVGWGPPCPEAGTHHYEFRVFALSEPSGVTDGQAGEEAAEVIETAPALATAALSGTSTPPGPTTTAGG
jgi:Raf kinase inhibitor-like YbhB/YbcL family protein